MTRTEALKQIQDAARVLFGEKASDSDIQRLKQKINHSTHIGSLADSGGYLQSEIAPMCDYDTTSVICVLRDFASFDKDTDMIETKKEQYYSERW